MRNLLKYAGVSLLVVGLAACDGKSDKPAADSGTQTSEATKAGQTTQDSASAQSAQTVSLLDGKLSFTLPAGVTDKTGKLGTQSNNMHVYADESGQQAIIVIVGDENSESLAVLAKRMEEQQRLRLPDLKVLADKEITVNGQQMQQLDTLTAVNNQPVLSSLILGKIDGKLVTLQISQSGDKPEAAQAEADKIISTLRVK